MTATHSGSEHARPDLHPDAASLIHDAPDLPDPTKGDLNYRVWCTRHPISAAMIAGWVATIVITTSGLWFNGVGLPQVNWPITNARVFLPADTNPAAQFVLGYLFVVFVNGVIFALLYVVVAYPLLSRVIRTVSPATNLLKAFIWSMVLSTVAAGWVTPYVYDPHNGAGVFSTGLGWKVIFAIYLGHALYAVNLAAFYNPIKPGKS
jgi:hypothetical protein